MGYGLDPAPRQVLVWVSITISRKNMATAAGLGIGFPGQKSRAMACPLTPNSILADHLETLHILR